jgi:flagellar P-ring protein precursor FlgI
MKNSSKIPTQLHTTASSWLLPFLAGALLTASALVHAESAPQKARVKDVATIEGIRDNQLVGYGLVVGLHATGDSSQTVFPAQTLISALERMGVTVPQTGSNSASNMQVKNMAGVFVVATLPPFSRPGYKMDITVSSAGDARSLEGGILLMTPLYGPRARWCWAATWPQAEAAASRSITRPPRGFPEEPSSSGLSPLI